MHFTGRSSQFLFSRIADGRRLDQYMIDGPIVGGSWFVVCDLSSVAGRLLVVLYCAGQTKTFLNVCETVLHRMDKRKSSIEIASLEGLTLWGSEINQSKPPLAW